jgi:hypothetical protein
MEIIAQGKAAPVSLREDLRTPDQANVAAKEKARSARQRMMKRAITAIRKFRKNENCSAWLLEVLSSRFAMRRLSGVEGSL